MRGLIESELPLPVVARGKVRDVYDAGDDRLLIVTTDRVSAFDVVMAQPIPGKGTVLNQLTAWWLSRLLEAKPHHMISADRGEILASVPELTVDSVGIWERRAMLVHRTEPIPVECVVRGYMAGSAWGEYRRSGSIAGQPQRSGLRPGDALDEPLFSPATKAETGHDVNITVAEMRDRIGTELTDQLQRRTLELYLAGSDVAAAQGMILADTKFEFGRLPDGQVVLIDEVLTPDSSRFWPMDTYSPGSPQPSLDKQGVRDYLEGRVEAGEWNREPPPPPLPATLIESISERYRTVFRNLTGLMPEGFPLSNLDQAKAPRGVIEEA